MGQNENLMEGQRNFSTQNFYTWNNKKYADLNVQLIRTYRWELRIIKYTSSNEVSEISKSKPRKSHGKMRNKHQTEWPWSSIMIDPAMVILSLDNFSQKINHVLLPYITHFILSFNSHSDVKEDWVVVKILKFSPKIEPMGQTDLEVKSAP